MDSFHHKIKNVQSPHQTKHIDKHKTATIKTTETNFDFLLAQFPLLILVLPGSLLHGFAKQNPFLTNFHKLIVNCYFNTSTHTCLTFHLH